MKNNINKAFTIIEVSILLVVFLIVAFLVALFSLNDSKQANNDYKWKDVQGEFANIFATVNSNDKNFSKETFKSVIDNEIIGPIKPYKIIFLNGTFPSGTYRFTEYLKTQAGATLAYKFLDEPQGNIIGLLMYDVNGNEAPNTWGKDVFGYNIYNDKFEPFCKNDTLSTQKKDCSKNGTGLCCSEYNLNGGNYN